MMQLKQKQTVRLTFPDRSAAYELVRFVSFVPCGEALSSLNCMVPVKSGCRK